MEIHLYTLSKRNKSDLAPIGDGYKINVEIKDNCSVEFPEMVFDFDPVVANYNYMVIPKWHRSYFIAKSSYFHGRWFVKATEDYLVSWNLEIKNTRAYVLYDVNTYDIVDERIPAVSTPVTMTNSVLMRRDFNTIPLADGGTYVVTVTGENGVSSYTITSSQMNNLLINFTQWFDTLYGDQSFYDASIGKCIAELMRQLLGTKNAPDNIKSCVWLPMSITALARDEIHLGLYDTNITTGKLGINPIRYESTSIDIPWQANDWRRNSPYTQLYLYIPYIGMVNYPTSDLIDKTYLVVESSINVATGEMSVLVKSGTQVLGTYGTNIAANIPIGSSGISPASLITSIIKGGVTAATGSGVSTALTAGSSILKGLEPMGSTIGGMGGGTASNFSNNLECTTVYHNTLVEPYSVVDIIGAPTMYVKSLADASGFVQTAGFQIACNGTASEKDAINALMDSGVYFDN